MNTKDRKENQLVLIEFSEEQQAFNFNLDGADKTAPSYMPIAWLPHLDAVRWTQEMKNLRADHRLTLEEVVERSMTPLVRLGTIKLECVRHMHKIRRDEVNGLSDEKRDEFFNQHTQEAKKFMLDDIFHTRLVEAGVCDIPDNKNIIVWAEMFVGVKDGIDIDKELAGEDYEPGHVEPKPESKFGHFETDPETGKTKFVRNKKEYKDIRERFNEKNLIGTASIDQEPKRLPENLLPVDADFLASHQYDENSGLQPYLDKLMADGEIKPVSRHLNLKSIGDTPVSEKIAGLGDPIVIEIPDAVEEARNFDPYPPLDQETVEKTFKIVYPEDADDSEKWVLYHIVLEYSGLLTSERLVEYATDKDSDFMRWEMARELCDVLCRAWVNDMPGGTFMDHRPHVKVDYSEYVKGNGGKIIVVFSTTFLH